MFAKRGRSDREGEREWGVGAAGKQGELANLTCQQRQPSQRAVVDSKRPAPSSWAKLSRSPLQEWSKQTAMKYAAGSPSKKWFMWTPWKTTNKRTTEKPAATITITTSTDFSTWLQAQGPSCFFFYFLMYFHLLFWPSNEKCAKSSKKASAQRRAAEA